MHLRRRREAAKTKPGVVEPAYLVSKLRAIAAISITIALAAVPALAAAPEDDARRGDATRAALRSARVALEGMSAVLRREAQGPFAPVAGGADFGTAENAFGAARSGHVHSGHDLFAPAGTPLVAVTDGVVAEAGSDGSQGNYVYLYDPKRERTYVYMHMLAPADVRTGEGVEAGERIGELGCTGSCWGDHLHFEIRAGRGIAGEASDPRPELERWRELRAPLD
jgi:murein DD-endopeptidase MepM/ murein hydrolase activator NlpD